MSVVLGNGHSETFADMGRRPEKKKRGLAAHPGNKRHFGTKSNQCAAGNHFACLKKTCPCGCGHGGIR